MGGSCAGKKVGIEQVKDKDPICFYLSRTTQKKLWEASYYLSSPPRNFPNNICFAPLSFAQHNITSLSVHPRSSTQQKETLEELQMLSSVTLKC